MPAPLVSPARSTTAGIPSPAQHDPGRNRHRTNSVWTLRTVAAILANPRYTGRQVWNRQHTDHRETVPGDKRSSLGPTRTWNPKSEWIISENRTHPALISDADFLAAQHVSAIHTPNDDSVRRYALTGLLVCGLCGRRLEGHWVHGRPGYRCRHGHISAHSSGARPRAIYWPERRITTEMLHDLKRQGALTRSAGVEGLATHLRDRDLVIVCNPGKLTLDRHLEHDTAPKLGGRTTAASPPLGARTRIPAQRGIQKTPPHPSPRGMNLVGVNVSGARHEGHAHPDRIPRSGLRVVSAARPSPGRKRRETHRTVDISQLACRLKLLTRSPSGSS
ncbi:recombinase family protein [Paractinoplanes lichenicola]|uniref:recombinase family protein n=1 Tax=Paractinoplanes lichenicola TaxID=2802976 RepID=UPI0027DBB122|nr:recombinase family protein [Actinoplanes lichenicola]